MSKKTPGWRGWAAKVFLLGGLWSLCAFLVAGAPAYGLPRIVKVTEGGPVSAVPGELPEGVAPGSGEVIARVALHPTEDTTVQLSGFAVEYLASGERRIVATRNTTEPVVEESIFFVADPALGTYRAVELTSSEDENREILREFLLPYSELGADREALLERLARDHKVERAPLLSLSAALEDPPGNCEDLGLCTDTCAGNWSATVKTLDPVFIELTRTAASAFWGERAGTLAHPDCRWFKNEAGSCWAANPSALGTHWFLQQCTVSFPTGAAVDVLAFGSYINWDFGLNSLSTSVAQTARVTFFFGGGVSATYSHQDSGEGSLLIFGSFSQSGSNTC